MKKKLNISNLMMLIVFIGSLVIIVSDLIVIFTNIDKASWTILGTIIFAVATILCQASWDYLVDESIKKEK